MNAPRQSKATTFDLVTLICFTTPVVNGWMEGSKLGFAAWLVGVILGILFGVLTAIGFRTLLSWIAERLSPEEKSGVRLAVNNILLLMAQFVWVCGVSLLLFLLIRFVIHQIVASGSS
jgi:hypothetical protein